MRASFTLIFASLFVLAANAAPCLLQSQCNPKKDTLVLPANQTTISVPANVTVAHIALGVGFQNYTCSDAGTYVSAGAVAGLWDITCLYNTSTFATIQDSAYNLYACSERALSVPGTPSQLPPLGRHFFVTTPGNASTISPEFEFFSGEKGKLNPNIVAKKLGGVASPSGAANVDWLELQSVSGNLAKYVFRVDTKGGQPPASCPAGSPSISVKYSAKYWFFS